MLLSSRSLCFRHLNCSSMALTRHYRAVIFDLGGVLIPSPKALFFETEVALDMPSGTIVKAVMSDPVNGAWSQLERGELSTEQFERKFSDECSAVAGRSVNLSGLLHAFRRPALAKPYPVMLDAIRCLRAEGIKTALLTNNWKMAETGDLKIEESLFDVIVESCKLGARKPEPLMYETCLKRLGLSPGETIFLDDLGVNLKPARGMGITTIKVGDDKSAAISQLEALLDMNLRHFVPGTITVPPTMQLNAEKLRNYLAWVLKVHTKELPCVRFYEYGQSNPTYYVWYGGKQCVLRKKPPGKLLPSAHMVEREYRVMEAVAQHGLPVPKVIHLCEDESLLGTPFYVMEYVQGRIFKDISLPGMKKAERRAIYQEFIRVLAKLHSIDIQAAGLSNYGKTSGFLVRNLTRWVRQYEMSKVAPSKAFDSLITWLKDNIPNEAETTLIHGDFRLNNVIYHPTEARVIAVLDWELSTLGDPLCDLGHSCLPYYSQHDSTMEGLAGEDLEKMGIPSLEEFLSEYSAYRGNKKIRNWEYYVAFTHFRAAAIAQGVYKRSLQGQGSSSTGNTYGAKAEAFAQQGLSILKSRELINKHNSHKITMLPAMPFSVEGLRPKARDIHKRVCDFVQEHVIPLERDSLRKMVFTAGDEVWTPHPVVNELKEKARSMGLWNLFIPEELDPQQKWGAGLTNLEYALICEVMGKYACSEIFNCSAPDTGNMEVLMRYGTAEQQRQWLDPLLRGEIRSCFGMTEPEVASSDARNISSSIVRDGNEYVINGRKWWTSGAMHPMCKVCVFMGKTDPDGRPHKQQSMILVPMDAPGVKIVRPLSAMNFLDGPGGHAEVLFENVRVPVSNMLLGEGRGFEIAQGRLGPGRIHHCMRLIGNAERALELMVKRSVERKTFGKRLAEHGVVQAQIAESRMDIEQGRLLVLKTAHMMDTVGNKVAAPEIAMIKVVVPRMAAGVIDRAIQVHGGAGVSSDFPLAAMYSNARCLRLADGPDEVHTRTVARIEFMRQMKRNKL